MDRSTRCLRPHRRHRERTGSPHGGAADSIHFPTAAAASLRFATPGDLSDHHAAYEFRGALMGRVERPQGIGQGSLWNDGVFIPTALAHAGASFEWATPSEVTRRAQIIVAAMLTKPDPIRPSANLVQVP